MASPESDVIKISASRARMPSEQIKDTLQAFSLIGHRQKRGFHIDEISVRSDESSNSYDDVLHSLADEIHDIISPKPATSIVEARVSTAGNIPDQKTCMITPRRIIILLGLFVVTAALVQVLLRANPTASGRDESPRLEETQQPTLIITQLPTTSPSRTFPTPFPTGFPVFASFPSNYPTTFSQAPTSATTAPPTSSPVTFEERITRICAEKKPGNGHIGICLDEDNFAQCNPDATVKHFNKSCTNRAKCVCDPFVRVKDLRPCDGDSKDDDCILF